VTNKVQVAVAADVNEAEEIQEILREAGIASDVETAVDHHPSQTEDVPQKVLVPESELEAALEAIEAMSEPDELLGE
jgi:nanoRNase/pAp phosphatase (c-di-AMP/oligoRNAs hydrolase)